MDGQSSKANLVPGLQRVPQFQPGLTLLYKEERTVMAMRCASDINYATCSQSVHHNGCPVTHRRLHLWLDSKFICVS